MNCRYHKDSLAIVTCSVCGKGLCASCMPFSGAPVCKDCAGSASRSAAGDAARKTAGGVGKAVISPERPTTTVHTGEGADGQGGEGTARDTSQGSTRHFDKKTSGMLVWSGVWMFFFLTLGVMCYGEWALGMRVVVQEDITSLIIIYGLAVYPWGFKASNENGVVKVLRHIPVIGLAVAFIIGPAVAGAILMPIRIIRLLRGGKR